MDSLPSGVLAALSCRAVGRMVSSDGNSPSLLPPRNGVTTASSPWLVSGPLAVLLAVERRTALWRGMWGVLVGLTGVVILVAYSELTMLARVRAAAGELTSSLLSCAACSSGTF